MVFLLLSVRVFAIFFIPLLSAFFPFLAVRTKMVYCKIDQTQRKVVVRYVLSSRCHAWLNCVNKDLY